MPKCRSDRESIGPVFGQNVNHFLFFWLFIYIYIYIHTLKPVSPNPDQVQVPSGPPITGAAMRRNKPTRLFEKCMLKTWKDGGCF